MGAGSRCRSSHMQAVTGTGSQNDRLNNHMDDRVVDDTNCSHMDDRVMDDRGQMHIEARSHQEVTAVS